jgi:mannosyltransferase
MAGRDRSKRGTSPGPVLLLVGAITLAGLLLRLPSFNDSLFGDELSTYFIVTRRDLGRVIDLLQGDTVDLNPPLAFMLAWASERLGDSPQLIRLGSLLAGVATIPLTYLLGVWTVGRRAGLVAAALIAFSPYLIFYSTEARAYALVMCLVLLSTLALWRALQTRRTLWWAAYAALSCSSMYAHYPAVFVLLAQVGWAFWTRPEARRALLAANLAAAIGYLPWLPTLLDNTGSPGAKVIELLEPFGLHAVRVDLGRWFLGHPHIPLASMPGSFAVTMLVAGLVAGIVGLALRARRAATDGRLTTPPAGTVFVLVLALAAPVGIALYSSVGDSVWNSRNLIASWPGLALAVGALVTAADGLMRLAAVALVVGAFAIGGVRMLDSESQRPDYEEAASFVDRVGAAGDPVVEVPAPSPGPLTPLGDVALSRFGDASPRRRPLLRLGVAPLGVSLRARPYQTPPAPPPEDIARRAASLARGGTLFLVAPGSASFAKPRGASVTAEAAGLQPAFGNGPPSALMTTALTPVHPFVRALPARFRHVKTRTFAGFMPVSVYVFGARGANGRSRLYRARSQHETWQRKASRPGGNRR